jgi:hypothetical protein
MKIHIRSVLPAKPSIVVLFLSITVSVLSLAPEAQARVHCFCKMQSLSTTIADFGEQGSYGTQFGHDVECRRLCDSRSGSYWASNQAAACLVSHGGTMVAFYAVGTRSYQAGNNYTCPASDTTAAEGSIVFHDYDVSRKLTMNGHEVMASGFSQVILAAKDTVANFYFQDGLPPHLKAFTYSVKLYRDNLLVQELSKSSPPVALAGGDVMVWFTGQPAKSVHGHTWKVEWYWFGPNARNGSSQFKIP